MYELVGFLSALLMVLVLVWLLLWWKRNMIDTELDLSVVGSTMKDAISKTKEISAMVGKPSKAELDPVYVTDDLLSQTYLQLNALADIMVELYGRYASSLDQKDIVDQCLGCFPLSNPDKINRFVSSYTSLRDQNIITMCTVNNRMYTSKVYVARLKQSLTAAASLYQRTAIQYEQTAGEIFDEIDLIRSRIAQIRNHIRSYEAALTCGRINSELDRIDKLIGVNGESRSVKSYKRFIGVASGG